MKEKAQITAAAVKAEGLQIGYRGKPLFAPFSLEVPRGSVNLLIGENGAGKSTLLRTLSGTLRAVAGRIIIDGNDLSKLSRKEMSRLLSVVHTGQSSGGGLTVREVVEMGRYPYTGYLGRLSESDRQILDNALQAVGIAHKEGSFLADISDGERQKVLIARALAQQTPIMLLDEPSNFLDVASRIELFQLIEKIVAEKGITVIISTHDIASALRFADNVITILNTDAMPVSVDPVGSENALRRLNAVFAHRNIVFDEKKNDFVIGSTGRIGSQSEG